MHERELSVEVAQTLDRSESPVSRANDPENTVGIMVGRSSHDLLDEAIKRIDATLGFAATEDSGVMDARTRNIGPGSAAGVSCSTRMRVPGGHWRLHVCGDDFVRRDDEFIITGERTNRALGLPW